MTHIKISTTRTSQNKAEVTALANSLIKHTRHMLVVKQNLITVYGTPNYKSIDILDRIDEMGILIGYSIATIRSLHKINSYTYNDYLLNVADELAGLNNLINKSQIF